MTQAVSQAPRKTRPRQPGKPTARLPLPWIAGILAFLPLANIIFDAATGGLGVEPVETLVRRTGWWALTLLVVTLAVTPVRRISGWNRLIKIRRPVGVIAFVYAVLHFSIYVSLEQWFALSYIIEDILERPFITAGFLALCLLTPLAATSTRSSIRKLGGKRWQRLHRLIYPASLLAVLHYFWLVKADTRPPLLYAAIVITLLLLRVKLPSKSGGKAKRPKTEPVASSP